MNEFTELVATISTREDLSRFLSRLEESQRGIFQTDQDVERFLSEKFSARVARALVAYAESEKVALDDPLRATEFFTSLRAALEAIPVVTMRIAFEPSRGQVGDFSRWFAENTGQHVVFNLVLDTAVIAGAVIEFRGKRGDYSLSKKLANFFEKGTADSQTITT